MKVRFALFLLAGVFAKTSSGQTAAGHTKPIPFSVKVEAEGGGKGQGMWTQAANDLAPKEVRTLELLIVAEIRKQEGVKTVPLDYQDDYTGIAVVAAKLPNGSGKWNYVASSAVLIAQNNGTDEFVTHDVLAEVNLTSLTHSIAYQFATVRLRAATGLWK